MKTYKEILTESKNKLSAYATMELELSNLSGQVQKELTTRFNETAENYSEETAWEELEKEFGL